MVLENFIPCSNVDRCLAEIKENYKLAVGLSRRHALNNPRINRGNLFCFPPTSSIYTYSVVIQTREDFYLLNNMNVFIGQYVENGLIVLWYRNSLNLTTIEEDDEQPEPLTVHHMLGAIVVLAVGLCLATLTFVVEHLNYLRKRSKNCNLIKK